MIRKLITLFKLGRKIAKSDILSIASKFKKPPLASGGFLNFDAIESMSDFAIFLPNLNKVINFLIIKFSTHYELKQYR